MQNEELPSYSYDFGYAGGEENLYYFFTERQLLYEIKFKASPYIFADALLFKNNIFEFVIAVVENPTGKRPPLDKFIPQTIANIVMDFFRVHERIIVYICDTSDSREIARARKFGSWFYYFNSKNGKGFTKMESELPDKGNKTIVMSLILRKENPYKIQIFEAFENLTSASDLGK